MGRAHPSIVMDVQVLVTHAASIALMEREMGHPPRLIRSPDVCYLFHARDAERLPGLVDRWEFYGIAAQVVHIPPRGSRPATVSPHQPEERPMSETTDHGHEGGDQTARPPTDAREPEGMMDAPPETEASFEEVER
jgi:hypothetical protein